MLHKLLIFLFALFSRYSTIPIESSEVSGLIIAIDDVDEATLDIWGEMTSIASSVGVKTYIYFTHRCSNRTFALESIQYRNKNISVIKDYSTDTIWVRDYGPIFYKGDNQHGIIDIEYRHERPRDDDMPIDFAYRFNYRLARLKIVIEGGNLISNGDGICITSDKVKKHNSESKLDWLRFYGCHRDLIIVKSLVRDQTQHVDMWLTWVNPNTLIMGLYKEHQDSENHHIMFKNYILLKSKLASNIDIVIMPMPSRGNDDLTRTYVNALMMNGKVIVPTYNKLIEEDALIEQEALTIWERYFEVYPVYAETLIKYSGAIHCIARTIPNFINKV